MVFAYVDSVMIGMFLPAEEIGYYRAAYNIVSAVSGLVSIPAVMFPVFVQLEERDLKKAFNRAFRYTVILCFPVIISTIVLGRVFITFVYGSDYLPALKPLYVLSTLILGSSFSFWSILFNAREKPECPVYVTFVAMIMNIVLNYFLILKLGMIGAGIATVISNAFSWIVLGILSKRVLGIFPNLEHILKPTISSVFASVFILLFKSNSIFGELVILTLSIFIYFFTLLVIGGISREDYRYVKEFLTLR